MPDNSTASPAATAAVRRRFRKCRTCGQPSLSKLRRGECPDCAGLSPLPLRGEGGRFISLHSEPTTADVYSAPRGGGH